MAVAHAREKEPQPTPEQIQQKLADGWGAFSADETRLLLSLLDQRDAEIQKLANQARDISQYLAEAKVGACPIPEGVRLLLNRAEHAESSLLRMTEERDQAILKLGWPDRQSVLERLARLTEAHERLRKAVNDIIRYRQHITGCEINQTDFCSCGLREAMDALDKAGKTVRDALPF